MSTLQEIKEKWAKGQGFDSWEIMRQDQGIDNVDLNIICKEYATQCVLASLEKASEKTSLIDNETSYVKQSEINTEENIILL